LKYIWEFYEKRFDTLYLPIDSISFLKPLFRQIPKTPKIPFFPNSNALAWKGLSSDGSFRGVDRSFHDRL